MIGNAILGVLGLANVVSEAATVVTAGQDAMMLIGKVRKVLATPEFAELREGVATIAQESKVMPDGSVHIGYVAHHEDDFPKAKSGGHWEWDWDALQGYVNPHWVEYSK